MKNRGSLAARMVLGSVVFGGVIALSAAGCGSATVESACAAYAKAFCAKSFECSSFVAELAYADQADCEASAPDACVPFLGLEDAASPDAVTTCANAYQATSCDDLFQGLLPDSCVLKGLRADGDSCSSGIQCQTGACEFGTGECGVCTKIAAAGEACPMGAPCERGTYCSQDEICTKFGAKGDNCGSGQLCNGSLACVGGKCVDRGKEGDPCTVEESVCSIFTDGLVCDPETLVCKAVSTANVGEDCGLVDGEFVVCAQATCVQGKCVARLAEGAECGGMDQADCDVNLDCVEGKCTTVEPAECN